jgi:hypothetical protein
MPEPTRQTKITLREMRSAGVRGLLVYCSDYRCSRSTAISGDRWADDVRLSDIEPLFTYQDRRYRSTVTPRGQRSFSMRLLW